jgi:hypothetical protein
VFQSDAPRPSSIMSKGHGKGSAKEKASQILSAAPRAISPRMRRSFVDGNIHLRPVCIKVNGKLF